MFGHFAELPAAGMEPVAPELPEVPEDDWLVVGVVVDELVAAWAATPPPRTRAPETASAAAVLCIARILLTSLRTSLRMCLTRASQTAAPGRTVGDGQEAVKKLGPRPTSARCARETSAFGVAIGCVCRRVRGEAAVDPEDLAGHERRVVRGEERDRARDLLRVAEPADEVTRAVPP